MTEMIARWGYCRYCGEPKEVVWLDSFSELTGQRNRAVQCRNPSCQQGCANITGHKAKWYDSRCIHCKAIYYDGWWSVEREARSIHD